MKKFSQVATAAVLAGVVSIGGAIVWSAGATIILPGLSAVRPYTQGSIGFMWNNDTGMRSVSGLGKYTVRTGKSFK